MKFRRPLVPEVVQTSEMDCGPACLKALLEGFRIGAGYDHLREVCQTDLDGTSIDTIEQVAIELGLDAEQVMVPVDHLLLPDARLLPAVVTVRQPNGFTHFVIVWKAYGNLLQVMDPATGRQWIAGRRFLDRVHVHSHAVPMADWREWAAGDEFIGSLRRRAKNLRLPQNMIGRLVEQALDDSEWRSLAALDAGIRMVTPMVRSGGLRSGRVAGRVLQQLMERVRQTPAAALKIIPSVYWTVLPIRQRSPEDVPNVVFRGAVLVRVRGWNSMESPQTRPDPAFDRSQETGLSGRVRASVAPMRQLFGFLRADGFLTPAALMAALLLSAGGVVFEALLYRTFLDITGILSLPQQRLGALVLLFGFLFAMLTLDFLTGGGMLRLGRNVEIRLRTYLLRKLPQLPDRYLGSRLVSDMAERSHAIHQVRTLPLLSGGLVHHAFELILTGAGVVWLDPASAPLVLSAAAVSVAIPLLAQSLVSERDLRFRTHSGGLANFYFDSLRGLMPVRAHGAEDAVKVEHEARCVEWNRSGLGLLRSMVLLEGLTLATSGVLTAWLLWGHVLRHSGSTVILLLVYWALNIPAIGRQLAESALLYPRLRNLTLRLLEPLAAGENTTVPGPEPPAGEGRPAVQAAVSSGISVDFRNVSVVAMGTTILEEFSLTIEPGSHVCVVGPSGAGKSSFVALLLGWHRPATGAVWVDGRPLDEERLRSLRRETAWVDPSVQIWNRSLLDNLHYGRDRNAAGPLIGQVVRDVELLSLVEKLPDGLQGHLGESGALVSGGEGQRIRLGRALLQPTARLVVLDEAFAALQREQRRKLLKLAKELWRDATVICVTHDVSESVHFQRVVVLEQGRIVEDGSPSDLILRPDSSYRRLLESDEALRRDVWTGESWRTLFLNDGLLVEPGKEERNDKQLAEPLLAASAARGSNGELGSVRGASNGQQRAVSTP